MQEQQLITLPDAAIVTWPEGAEKPKTKQLTSLAGIGALNGAFWGMLFGLLFFVPLLGLAVGAAFGEFGASMADVAIDDDFIKKTKDKVTEGTSALFLLTSDATTDKVAEQMKNWISRSSPRVCPKKRKISSKQHSAKIRIILSMPPSRARNFLALVLFNHDHLSMAN